MVAIPECDYPNLVVPVGKIICQEAYDTLGTPVTHFGNEKVDLHIAVKLFIN